MRTRRRSPNQYQYQYQHQHQRESDMSFASRRTAYMDHAEADADAEVDAKAKAADSDAELSVSVQPVDGAAATTAEAFQAFQRNQNATAEFEAGSSVMRINATTRQVHLLSLLPLSEAVVDETGNEVRTLRDYRVYLEAAGYVAMQHFNQRSPRVLSHLPQLLEGCDLQMSIELRDTRFSSSNAVLQLQQVFEHYPEVSPETQYTQFPFAMLGAARSAVSQTLSILGGVYDLPQISASSTSASLDNKARSPYFARTVPSNAGDAAAIAIYMEYLEVSYIGVIYIRDSFGTAYADDLNKESKKRGIGVVSAPYENGDDASILDAVRRLKKAGVKYIVGVFNPRTWKKVIRASKESGIIGDPEYMWLLSEASLELTQSDFRLEKNGDTDIAQAINGVGVVLLDYNPNENLDAAMGEFETNERLRQDFISKHVESFIFDDFSFVSTGATLYQYLNYDAVIALGLAACGAENEFFTGVEMHQSLLETEFEGVTGYVSFDHDTGTRNAADLRYRIENVLLSDALTDEEEFGFESGVSVHLDFREVEPVQELLPFVYYDNSTVKPPALPPVEYNLNLIPDSIVGIGLTLGSLAMLAAIGWLVWTIHFRKLDVVRISQPIFLGQLCVGAFVVAFSVVPMSLQEPIDVRLLNHACMAGPWMISLGFVTAFSALFSKTWRLNKLFGHGQGFRRIEVKARDVVFPFIILAVLNLVFLITWTIVAPLKWTRVNIANYDQFGRSVESYGTCLSGDSGTEKAVQMTSLICLVLINLLALLFANYQCYKARNLPTDFNESFYVALANASMLEACVLGGPILLVVNDAPGPRFLVQCVLVTIISFTMLLPIFIPKYLQRNIRKKRRAAGYQARVIVAARSSYAADDVGLSGSNTMLPHSESTSDRAKSGTTGVVRNNDYYFQRMSTASEGGGRRTSFFSTTLSTLSGNANSTNSFALGESATTMNVSKNFVMPGNLAACEDLGASGDLKPMDDVAATARRLPARQLHGTIPCSLPSRVSEETPSGLDSTSDAKRSAFGEDESLFVTSTHRRGKYGNAQEEASLTLERDSSESQED